MTVSLKQESTKSHEMTDEVRTRILFVWSTPRSMSTLMERCISRCRDIHVLHEPFTDAYYFSRRRISHRYGEGPALPESDYWRYAFLSGYKTGTTFVKELAFQGRPYIGEDVIQCAEHAFLYRHPSAVVRSLLPLKHDFTEDELGFTALEDLFNRVRVITGRQAMLLNGDELRSNPETFLQAYCRSTRLLYSSTMLFWEPSPLREWTKHEFESQRKWHGTLETSRGVIPPERSDFATPLIEDPSQREMLGRATEIFDRLERLRIGAGSKND